MGMEFELKYTVPSTERLNEIVAELAPEWQTVAMESIYYDTSDGALAKKHWTLRVRRENDASVLCMKTPPYEEGGVMVRGEWECEGDSPKKSLLKKLVADGAPSALLELTEGKLLQRRCGAHFCRRVALVVLPDATIEIAADSGTLQGERETVPLCELELEHKEGNTATTLHYGAALETRFALVTEERSKFARAAQLR